MGNSRLRSEYKFLIGIYWIIIIYLWKWPLAGTNLWPKETTVPKHLCKRGLGWWRNLLKTLLRSESMMETLWRSNWRQSMNPLTYQLKYQKRSTLYLVKPRISLITTKELEASRIETKHSMDHGDRENSLSLTYSHLLMNN